MTIAFYCPEMDADRQSSPSATKPGKVAAALRAFPNVIIKRPRPLTGPEIAIAHKGKFVADVLACKRRNGFGTCSKAVAKSLPYTTGAMLDAAQYAIRTGEHCAALCSGFHHAGYDFGGGFCTFNGLVIAALTLIGTGKAKRVAIIDADQHYGNGTDDILERLFDYPRTRIFHYTFGKDFHGPEHAKKYLARMRGIEADLKTFKPDVILYQAGADAHRDDPLGGVLSTKELYERDATLFGLATRLGIPVAWNLAGGYQQEPDGSIPKVIEIHLNTFRAAEEARKGLRSAS